MTQETSCPRPGTIGMHLDPTVLQLQTVSFSVSMRPATRIDQASFVLDWPSLEA